MSFDLALRWIEVLLAIAVLQRGAEHLRREPWLFLPQMGCALAVLAGAWVGPAMLGLWITGLAQLWRFRGPYNGGADKMLLLVISCVALARLVPPAAEMALGYLAVQLVLSYVVSGWVKLRNPDWRSGVALQEVFSYSIYPSSENLRALAARRRLLQGGACAVIGFELAFPLALVSPPVLSAALCLAAGFHLANAVLFGLNRFVWAWLAAFPALLWLQGQIT